MTGAELSDRLRARYPDVVVARDEVTLHVDPGELLETLDALREDPELRFDFLSCLTATDWPGREPRFWLSYELASLTHRHRVRVKVGLGGADPRVPSVASLFPTADWHERETYDFYGIEFDGHPDLRRILMPEDWEGWPLRRDEELGGVNTRFKGAFIPPVDRRTT
ncbi:MAG: NADH-quinone oxidoreductase subunit C [Actinomycetota bacterium]